MYRQKQVTHIPAHEISNGASTPAKKHIRVAAYCRVSTEQDEQMNSFENQINYYTDYITNHPDYKLAGIYADGGTSGTSVRHREEFQRMIEDCEAGKVDLVITKSISRFARNTQDCLYYSRKLKDLGIPIMFEKESINTMTATGELLFTILASLAQEESRSISENTTWGIRSLFKQGVMHLNANRFYGYSKNAAGELVIDAEQGAVVRWIYESFISGVSPDVITRKLNENGIPGAMGEPRWTVDTVLGILKNEKHKGDALLQKSYTTDFLTKTQKKNEGQVDQYYVSDNHEPIVSREVWEIAQAEIQRRKKFKEDHHLRTLGRATDRLPFTSRIFCPICNELYWRRRVTRKGFVGHIWKCKNKCIGREGPGCINVDFWDEALCDAFLVAWNSMLAQRDRLYAGWVKMTKGDDPWLAYQAGKFIELTEDTTSLKTLDLALVNKVLEHIDVLPNAEIRVFFLDGNSVVVPIVLLGEIKNQGMPSGEL